MLELFNVTELAQKKIFFSQNSKTRYFLKIKMANQC